MKITCPAELLSSRTLHDAAGLQRYDELIYLWRRFTRIKRWSGQMSHAALRMTELLHLAKEVQWKLWTS